MQNVLMPKPKGSKTPSTGDSEPPNEGEAPDEPKGKGETSLKVDVEDGQLVGKIASHRGVSVKKLFRMQDVQDFFTHLLLKEMELEAERLRKRKQ